MQVNIIGGGPAGLMAADVLSQAGLSVMIYDGMPSLGRKFLLAGRGGLNITHSEDLGRFLTRFGPAQDWLKPILEAFTPADTRRFCQDLGIETFVGSSGRVFPKCFKTSPFLRNWLGRLASAGVETRLRHRFIGWRDDGGARFATPDGEIAAFADATILALGGASWPRLGSDGAWVQALVDHCVDVTPLRAANCGFIASWPEAFSSKFAGTPLKSIAATFAGHCQHGECVVTEKGMEGGLIYTFSAALRDAIEREDEAILHIDLKPGLSQAALTQRLNAAPAKQSFSNRLRKAARLSPVAIALLRDSNPPAEPEALAMRIKNLPVRFTETQPVARAISTAGGISREALNDNLMIKSLPGTFAAGEMLDWEAPTGGYLLQASFATGAAAAKGVLKFLTTS